MTSTPSSSSHSKLTMKLLADTKNDEVLFAEASKSVVDFLLNILYLPLGTVAKLVGENGMLPGVANMHRSLQNLPHNFMLPQYSNKPLLNPNVNLFSPELSLLLSTTIGKASNSIAQISGVVRDGVTFLVMDDLVIQPITSVIDVVDKFNIKENAAFKEMVVDLGVEEGIELIKASMQTKMVLTTVFLKKEI